MRHEQCQCSLAREDNGCCVCAGGFSPASSEILGIASAFFPALSVTSTDDPLRPPAPARAVDRFFSVLPRLLGGAGRAELWPPLTLPVESAFGAMLGAETKPPGGRAQQHDVPAASLFRQPPVATVGHTTFSLSATPTLLAV